MNTPGQVQENVNIDWRHVTSHRITSKCYVYLLFISLSAPPYAHLRSVGSTRTCCLSAAQCYFPQRGGNDAWFLFFVSLRGSTGCQLAVSLVLVLLVTLFSIFLRQTLLNNPQCSVSMCKVLAHLPSVFFSFCWLCTGFCCWCCCKTRYVGSTYSLSILIIPSMGIFQNYKVLNYAACFTNLAKVVR